MTSASAAGVLVEAATVAGRAPSIHNTQPWQWRVDSGAMQLWAVPERQVRTTDPEGRMAAISCGAALHHARVALAVLGYTAQVTRLPDEAQPGLLAVVSLGESRVPTPQAMRDYQTIAVRVTDRRPVAGEPLAAEPLQKIAEAARAQGEHLHVLHRDQVIELAAAASYAQRAENADEQLREELGYWVGGEREGGAGIPDANLLTEQPQTTVPGRDFGRAGTLQTTAGHDSAASYALLYSDTDDPLAWLVAGEGMSAAWLMATELGIGVMPLSAVVEVPSTRERLRDMLTSRSHPHLVLRLGYADPQTPTPPHTPRLPVAETVRTQARPSGGEP
jgi:nitroreductase